MNSNTTNATIEAPSRPSIYSANEHALVSTAPLPFHVAIVMDGNRRWARKRGQTEVVGHWYGAEQLDRIIRAANELNIKTLTVYAFSTENWKRPKDEIAALMQLFENYLNSKRDELVKDGVSLHTIGNISAFPNSVQYALAKTKEATKQGDRIRLVLAINYGGRDDIRRAILKMAKEEKAGNLNWKEVSEETISSYLDTASFPDPDLLIRPSGEERISNFLIWQIPYTEIYFSSILWPEFSEKDFLNAIMVYQNRKRRFGS